MTPFIYQSLPSRVVFGEGTFASLADEVRQLGKRALILSTPNQRDLAETAGRMLGDLAVGIYDRAEMHVPSEIAEDARKVAELARADVCVVVGGGSTIGLGKAIALTNPIPLLAVPTTYAGSEMTPIWGLTENEVKTTGRDARVQPKTVIYDPLLTLSLPPSASGTSGMNAIAHCVEALYAKDTNPILQLMAEEGIRALAESLPDLAKHPDDLGLRGRALYGAWLAGTCLGASGVALHHKLCHTLGGAFNLPHAETHTIILPYAVAYNADAVPEAMKRLSRALGTDDPSHALCLLVDAIGAKNALRDLGMPADGIAHAADLAMKNPYWNPQPVTHEGILALLSDAYEGSPPRAWRYAAFSKE